MPEIPQGFRRSARPKVPAGYRAVERPTQYNWRENPAMRAGRGLVGAVESAAALGTGIPLGIAGEVAGAVQSIYHDPSKPSTGANVHPDELAGSIAGMAYRPRTQAGQEMVEGVGRYMAPVGRAVDWTSRLGRNPAEFGEHTIKALASFLPLKIARQTGRVADPSTSGAINTARRLGYSVDPTQMVHGEQLGGISRRAAVVAGGKAAVPASGSLRNQAVTQRVAAKDIGIAGETITPEALNRAVTDTNAAYTALQLLKNASGSPYRVNLARDSQYLSAVRKVMAEARNQVTGELDPTVARTVRPYLRPNQGVPVEGLMENIKQLRADANGFLKSDDPLAKAQGRAVRQIANALEGSLERQVGAQHPKLVADWKAARIRRAKVEQVREAMNGTEIDGRALARLRDQGEFLSGGLAEIADVAEAMPHMMQTNARLGLTQGMGVPDAAYMGLVGAGGVAAAGPIGLASAAAWPLGRLASRRYALSNPVNTSRLTAPVGAAATAAAAQSATRESFGDYVRRKQEEARR